MNDEKQRSKQDLCLADILCEMPNSVGDPCAGPNGVANSLMSVGFSARPWRWFNAARNNPCACIRHTRETFRAFVFRLLSNARSTNGNHVTNEHVTKLWSDAHRSLHSGELAVWCLGQRGRSNYLTKIRHGIANGSKFQHYKEKRHGDYVWRGVNHLFSQFYMYEC